MLSIIIPAYNEQDRILNTLDSVEAYLVDSKMEYEIIVVNDGSSDGTLSLVNKATSRINNLKCVSYDLNRGKGYAIAYGIKNSVGDIVLFMDADNSTTIDQVEPFIEAINSGYDLTIGSRRLGSSRIIERQPWSREILGSLFRKVTNTIVPLGVSDSQAGFKIMTRKVAKNYANKQKIFRWAFDVELLIMARANNWTIKELPVIWKNDNQSKVRFGGMLNMLWELFKIRYYFLSNYYKL